MSNIENLKEVAHTVRVETQTGANSAPRVGGLLEGIVEELGITQVTVNNIVQYLESKPNQGSSGVDLKLPLSVINILDRNPDTAKSFLQYNGSTWGYITTNAIAEEIKQYFTENNYWNTYGADLKLPLSSINGLNRNPTIQDSSNFEEKAFLQYSSTGWDYATVADISNDVKKYFNNHNYWEIYGMSLRNPVAAINSTFDGNPTDTNKKTFLYYNGQRWDYITSDNIAVLIKLYFDENHSWGSSGGGMSLLQPLTSINNQFGNANPTTDNTILLWKNSKWTYSTISDAIPGGDPTPGGGGIDEETIQRMRNDIDAANEKADAEIARLDALLDALDIQINDDVVNMDAFALWIQGLTPEGTPVWQQSWNDKIGEYLQTVGLWDTENGITKTFWTNFTQSWKNIGMDVNKVMTANDWKEYYKGRINTYIDENKNAVVSKLESEFAKKDAEKVIEWMYSGLTNTTSEDETVSELVSAGKNAFHNAIADIRTYVKKLKDGEYVAETDISTKVDSSIASIIQQVDSSSSVQQFFTKVNKASDDITELTLRMDPDGASASLATAFDKYNSGVVTTSNLDGAIVSLIAQDIEGGAIAQITARVAEGVSELVLSAEKISNITSLYTINTNCLRIGGQNLLIHAYADASEEHNISIEFVLGDFEENGDGNIKEIPGGICHRIRFGTLMATLPRILTNGIVLTEENHGNGINAGNSSIDLPSSVASIRFFNHISGSHVTGWQYGHLYTAEDGEAIRNNPSDPRYASATTQLADGTETGLYGVDQPTATIGCYAGGIVINGNLTVNGTFTHNS